MAKLFLFQQASLSPVASYTALSPVQIQAGERDKTSFAFTDTTGDRLITSNLQFIVEN